MDPRQSRMQRALTAWARHLSGCQFAQTLIQDQKRVRFLFVEPWTKVEEVVGDLDTNLLRFGEEENAAIVAFPDVAKDQDVIALVRSLAQASDRWTWTRRDADPVKISVFWRTANNDMSDALGLGPFLSMPETRRAPYVCLALWPGRRTKAKAGLPISFNDMPSQVDDHAGMIKKTKAIVAEILGADRPQPGDYFTFRLPRLVVPD